MIFLVETYIRKKRRSDGPEMGAARGGGSGPATVSRKNIAASNPSEVLNIYRFDAEFLSPKVIYMAIKLELEDPVEFQIEAMRERTRKLLFNPAEHWPKAYPKDTISLTFPYKVMADEREYLRETLPMPKFYYQNIQEPYWMESEEYSWIMIKTIIYSLLGGRGNFLMDYNFEREGNCKVTLLFDTEEGALCFKQAPQFAKIASFVDTPRFD